MTTTLKLEALTCPSCLQKIQKALQKTNGVQDVQVRFNAGKAIVQADPDVVSSQALADVVTKLGYTVKKITTK